MAKILVIDSSTEACSVALENSNALKEEQHIISRFEHAPRKHAELLLPMVDSVLTEADLSLDDLDAIGCCVGPGAFTGLRIAISVAQGLAYAVNLPCIAISSLQALAAETFSQTNANVCLASIDARMQEVYFAGFKRNANLLPELVHPEEVIAAGKIQLSPGMLGDSGNKHNEHILIAKPGTGWSEYQYPENIESIIAIDLNVKFPNAKAMLSIAQAHFNAGQIVNPENLQPVYLRNNVAKKKSAQK